ncbi:hypothetical protein KBTX_03267 [wastewater metagenome]|uniref:Polysaccharide chain length determinant N-terminal domain-containing protein n=2 Tax=unclassified sequences TaxID=12908 RepID=A0A5B8RHG7_9ZZZZ|nr:Wzz/FepE/Etk N-terminal domain-containing protein [Arhodomonas sp. KWT]QEA06924.1 hypothetical protein KBTEX_03267 [uncultured organism]
MSRYRQNAALAREDHYPVASALQPGDDEISLLDLALVLYRRRWLMAAILATIVALTALYAALRTPAYTYTTVLEVGSYLRGPAGERNRVPVAASPTVRERLQQAIVPVVRGRQSGAERGAPKVAVSGRVAASDAAPVFVLRSEAAEADARRIQALHQGVVDRLIADHRKRLGTVRTDRSLAVDRARARLAHLQADATRRARTQPKVEAVASAARAVVHRVRVFHTERVRRAKALEQARLKIDGLGDERRLLQARQARLEDREALADEQLDGARRILDRLAQSRARVVDRSGSPADAMALLTIDSRIAGMRKRVDTLSERLRVTLPDRRDELANALENNARARKRAAGDLAKLEREHEQAATDYQRELAGLRAALDRARTALMSEREAHREAVADASRAVRAAENEADTIVPTDAAFVAQRSASPIGPGAVTILALGGALGTMMALFGAFLAEFVGRARHLLR